MTKADKLFKDNIRRILDDGVVSGNARPIYSDGRPAHSKYITGVFSEYDLSKDEFPPDDSSPNRSKVCDSRNVLDLQRSVEFARFA